MNAIKRIGPTENKIDIKIFVVGTFTFQLLGGGLLVNNSTIKGSCRVTYEASTFVAPLIALPGLSIARINWSRSTRIADSTSLFEIAAKTADVSTLVN